MNSDFPEFDQAYRTVLVKDLKDKFEQLAAAANFNIYHSDIGAALLVDLLNQLCSNVLTLLNLQNIMKRGHKVM